MRLCAHSGLNRDSSLQINLWDAHLSAERKVLRPGNWSSPSIKGIDPIRHGSKDLYELCERELRLNKAFYGGRTEAVYTIIHKKFSDARGDMAHKGALTASNGGKTLVSREGYDGQ